MLVDEQLSAAERAECFHSSMAQVVVDQAEQLRHEYDIEYVGLTGGVFQNRFLTDTCIERLSASGFDVRLAGALPCNDGGLSYGQAVEIAARDQGNNAHG